MNRAGKTTMRAKIFSLGAVLAIFLAVNVTAAGANGTIGGTATITNPSNNTALGSGGSTTTFTVAVPSGAACPGDTANGGYHVYSYLIQAGSDITGVTFVNAPSSGYGFVDNTGSYYGPANTAINTGQIISIPTNFQWAPVVTTLGLPLSTLLYSGSSGAWDGGLVCTDTSGHVVSSWNTRITFTASGSDPNGFTWAAVPGVPSLSPEVPYAAALPVVGAAAIAVVVTTNRRRSRRAGGPLSWRFRAGAEWEARVPGDSS